MSAPGAAKSAACAFGRARAGAGAAGADRTRRERLRRVDNAGTALPWAAARPVPIRRQVSKDYAAGVELSTALGLPLGAEASRYWLLPMLLQTQCWIVQPTQAQDGNEPLVNDRRSLAQMSTNPPYSRLTA